MIKFLESQLYSEVNEPQYIYMCTSDETLHMELFYRAKIGSVEMYYYYIYIYIYIIEIHVNSTLIRIYNSMVC